MQRIGTAAIAVLAVVALAGCSSEDTTASRASTSTTSGAGDPTVTDPVPSTSAAPPPTAAPLAPGEVVTYAMPADAKATFRPLVVGDRTLVPVEGGLVSLAADGTVEWNAQFCDFSPLWADEQRVVPGPVLPMVCNERFFGVSPVDGSVVWETEVDESTFLDAPSDDTTVVIESHDGVRVLDLATGAPGFERPLGELQSRSAVDAGLVFVGDGSTNQLVALDAVTGAESWSRDVDMGLLLAHGGLVFVLGDEKTITTYDGATGEPRWTSAAESRLQSTALVGVSGGQLVVVTGQDLVLAYDVATGAITWTFNEEDAGKVSLTLGDGVVLAGQDGQHHVIDAASGTVVRVDPGTSAQRVGVAPGRYVDAPGSTVVVHSLG